MDGQAVDGPLVVDDVGLMIRGAIDGAGLAYVYEDQVAEPIASGRLRRVLDAWCPELPGFFLYHPSNKQMPVLLRAFIDAAKAAVRATARDPAPFVVR